MFCLSFSRTKKIPFFLCWFHFKTITSYPWLLREAEQTHWRCNRCRCPSWDFWWCSGCFPDICSAGKYPTLFHPLVHETCPVVRLEASAPTKTAWTVNEMQETIKERRFNWILGLFCLLGDCVAHSQDKHERFQFVNYEQLRWLYMKNMKKNHKINIRSRWVCMDAGRCCWMSKMGKKDGSCSSVLSRSTRGSPAARACNTARDQRVLSVTLQSYEVVFYLDPGGREVYCSSPPWSELLQWLE